MVVNIREISSRRCQLLSEANTTVIGFFGQDPVDYSPQCGTAGTHLNLDGVSYIKDPVRDHSSDT
jgi:hypothetical protein